MTGSTNAGAGYLVWGEYVLAGTFLTMEAGIPYPSAKNIAWHVGGVNNYLKIKT